MKANFKKSTFYVELKQKPPVIHTGGFCLVLNCVYYTLKKQKSEIVVGITYNVNVRKNEGRKSG